MVTKAWSGAVPQAITDKGYIYFVLDNRGSGNRGVGFEKPIYRAMGGYLGGSNAKATLLELEAAA